MKEETPNNFITEIQAKPCAEEQAPIEFDSVGIAKPPYGSVKKTIVPSKRKPSLWTSIERTKVAISILTPALIAGIGIYATRQAHQQDASRTAREDLRAKKISSASTISLMMNQEIAIAIKVREIAELRQGPISKREDHEYLTKLGQELSSYSTITLLEFGGLKANFTDPNQYKSIVDVWKRRVAPELGMVEACKEPYATDDRTIVSISRAQCAEQRLLIAQECMTFIADALIDFDALPLSEIPELIEKCNIPSNIAKPYIIDLTSARPSQHEILKPIK